MYPAPYVAVIARRLVAEQMIGAHADDPVVPEEAPNPPRVRAPRARRALAAGLHRLADAVGPTPHRRHV